MTLFHKLTKFTSSLGQPKRSNEWPTIRRAHLKVDTKCNACGGVLSLEVHHIAPFHLHPELELVDSNLITLCETTKECHLKVGHLGNWKNFNVNVRTDAAALLANARL